MFGLAETVSKSSNSKEIKLIFKHKDISVFECPGLDKDFNINTSPDKIPLYLGCMEHIYYLYDGYIDEDVVKTFAAMRKKFYGVRTKCDPDE